MKARRPVMSKKQQKAMDEEIIRQLLERDEGYDIDSIASFLWAVRVCEPKYGAKRLRRLFDTWWNERMRLREYYQMGANDDGFICRHKLKDIGVDVEAWYRSAGTEPRAERTKHK